MYLEKSHLSITEKAKLKWIPMLDDILKKEKEGYQLDRTARQTNSSFHKF